MTKCEIFREKKKKERNYYHLLADFISQQAKTIERLTILYKSNNWLHNTVNFLLLQLVFFLRIQNFEHIFVNLHEPGTFAHEISKNSNGTNGYTKVAILDNIVS